MTPDPWKELDAAELAVRIAGLPAGTPCTVVDTDPDCFMVEIAEGYGKSSDTIDERVIVIDPEQIRRRTGA